MTDEPQAPVTRDEFLEQVKKVHADLVKLIDAFPETKRETPIVGDRSLKDVLAHITDWEDYALLRLRSAAAGDPIPARVVDSEDVDRINEEVYQAHHLEDWHGVRYEFDRTFQEICAEAANLPNEGLTDPANGLKLIGLEGVPPMELLYNNTTGHYFEHWDDLQRALAS